MHRTSLDRTSDTELVVSRTFRAPASIVFDAYTRPEYVTRWWASPSSDTTAHCVADVCPGGTYRYVLERGGKLLAAFSGRYVEVERPNRLVYTQIYEAFPGPEVIVTVSFEERGGSTTFVAHEQWPSKEALDGALASGMERGVHATFDLLADLVETLAG